MVYFFYGPETFRKREQSHALLREIQKKGDVKIGVFSGAQEGAVAEAIDFLSSTTLFFEGKRLALVKQAELFSIDDMVLLAQRASMDRNCVALIVSSWTERDYKTHEKKLSPYITKKQYFKILKGNDLISYLSLRSKQKGLLIEKKALVLLHSLYGDAVALLSHEIDRLSLLGRQIHISDILALPEHKEETTLFEGSRALMSGSLAERLSLFETLLFQGISTEALFYYMSAVASKKSLIERLSVIDARMKQGDDLDLLFLSYIISQR